MKKIEMIRCSVVSPNKSNPNPEGGDKSLRFIPSEIYRLWRYLMEQVKGFGIAQEIISFWVDEELYSRDKSGYGAHTAHPVVEISFVYFKDTHVGRPVIRYFPLEYYQMIMGYFMKNFTEDYIKSGPDKKTGFFIEPAGK